MKITDLIGLAFSRLGTGKMRAALTMLGVIIGVASVVALVSVAQGATKGISDRLQSLGTNLLTVSPGFTSTGATRGGFGTATTLTIDDANALVQLDGVQAIAPELTTNKLVIAGTQNETARVVGTTPGYVSVFANDMWVGSFLNQASVDNKLRVAVIGATTADNLSLTETSVGSTIYIGGLPFDLIGILQPKGGTSSTDDQVLIPLSTAHELFVGSNSVSAIGVSAANQDVISTVSAEITATLEQRHGITTGVDDFSIATQAQLLGTVSGVSDTLTLLLAGIASISLLVGGIGIMNIMLVSVRERTREIGIRKAIGARGRDILSQFLVEALALSLAGGLIGVGLGVVASYGIGVYAGWGFVFNPVTVVVAVLFSLIVGIVFGVWPASQAARLDPVVALRYE
ncbi:MAG TPA: ABC transporter permease [Candidatus Limnocylindrales bacterium]|nr:ABC transporter permease [Candidatus Limnocylindrales bacterium]